MNGEPVYVEDLKRLLEQVHSAVAAGPRSKPDLDRLMYRLVNDTLLAQEARAMGMDQEDPIPARMAARRESLAIARLEKEEITSRAEARDEEIQQAFETEYRRITFRILTVREREKAAALRGQIEKGADFATVARENSVDPYAPKGGLVEGLARIDTPHEFQAAIFALEPGALEGPLVTRIGYSVVRVESFAAADPARLDELKPSLRTLVQFRKAEALRADLGTRLRAAHKVVIDEAVAGGDRPRAAPRREADAEDRGPRRGGRARRRPHGHRQAPRAGPRTAVGGGGERGGGPRGEGHRPRPPGAGGADGGRGPGPRLRGHEGGASARCTPPRPSSSSRAT